MCLNYCKNGVCLPKFKGWSTSCPVGNGVLTPGVKLPEYEADHSAPSSAEVKTAWS